MKKFKLNTLILSSLVATATIVPCLTSCNKSTIKVNGAGIDMSKSHIEVDRDSTIYLVPNNGSKITGIKNITVGTTVLSRMAYTFEYEQQANAIAYKLTIFAKSMTSLDIAIEVNTTDIDIAYASYNGHTLTTGAVLNSYTLEVVAKYKNVEGYRALAAGEYLVFDEAKKDITSAVLSADGYKMDQAKTYKFTIKSAIDTSKTTNLSITITKPEIQGFFEIVEYSTPKDDECMLRIADFDPTGFTEISPIPEYVYVGGVTRKYVTGIANINHTLTQGQIDIIKTIRFDHRSKQKPLTIETGAFKGLTKLEQITLPATTTEIKEKAFEDCTSLSSVTFEDTTNWKQNGTAIVVTNPSDNADQLKDTTTSTAWGYTGIKKEA